MQHVAAEAEDVHHFGVVGVRGSLEGYEETNVRIDGRGGGSGGGCWCG